MQLDFGAPDNGIMQMCWVVPDIEEAIANWVDHLGVGPWFLLENFTGVDPMYRGEPSRAEVKLAMSFSGHMNVELIQPKDDHPSVYKDHIDAKGHGFHHYGIATGDFAADHARYLAKGYDAVFELGVPTGDRVAYFDPHGEVPGYLELIETSEVMEGAFTNFWKQTIGWDGTDPIRAFA